jgi:hypothetical protein
LYDPTNYAFAQCRDRVDASLVSPSTFVEAPDTIFSIPTYRLRDVPETVERYDENFWRNGHEVALFVFDDSSLANHDKYYSQLGKTRTANPLYYVGPREKERGSGDEHHQNLLTRNSLVLSQEKFPPSR